ncbi:Pvc16 family protein [Streptomyces platensis]|uniref:Pvc16 family protein n=1 Tax=Streptomyces platensis TaxID=58346 RepID=UPI002E10EC65|nr:Pvc16 family protein [Streptomyces platensis]
MSNALAVATVTQALALLIEHHLHPEIDMAVSVETRKPPSDPPTEPTITVFLYQVSHNPSMRNSDLATRASDGTLLKRPAAAIDLHFVISAYGEETELVGQRLIGSVVRTLHEIPVLPKELIEEAARRPYLAGSDLTESPQKVRFTPTQMDVDETSKLWGMLHNTPYSLSVVYQASLVLLDGHQKPVPAKPVQRPDVRVLPFGAPGAPEPGGVAGGAGATAPTGSAGTAESAGDQPAGAPARTSKRAGAKAPGTEAAGAPSGESRPGAAKTATKAGATSTVRATVAKAASGSGARAAKKAAGGGSAGARGAKSAAPSARSRARKATGGDPADGADRQRGADRTREAGRTEGSGRRADDAGRADGEGRGRADDGKES